MPDFLLDTNVFSEFTKLDPTPSVVAFLADRKQFWTSVIVYGELEYGARLLPQGHRRDTLEIQISFLLGLFKGRILPIGEEETKATAFLRAKAKRSGHPLALGDALIAGTAVANNLALVTRNVRDFENLEIGIVNPWDTDQAAYATAKV